MVEQKTGLIPLGVPPTIGMVSAFFSQFRCQECGQCCTEAKSSTDGILLEPNEDEKLAQKLKISLKQFKKDYTFTHLGNRVMKYPCIFYKKGCSIYHDRPATCRFYPINVVLTHKGTSFLTLNPNCHGGKELMEELWKKKSSS